MREVGKLSLFRGISAFIRFFHRLNGSLFFLQRLQNYWKSYFGKIGFRLLSSKLRANYRRNKRNLWIVDRLSRSFCIGGFPSSFRLLFIGFFSCHECSNNTENSENRDFGFSCSYSIKCSLYPSFSSFTLPSLRYHRNLLILLEGKEEEYPDNSFRSCFSYSRRALKMVKLLLPTLKPYFNLLYKFKSYRLLNPPYSCGYSHR